MIQASSFLATTDITSMTLGLLVHMAWPSLIAGVTTTILAMALLSFGDLTDTNRPFAERFRSSTMSSIFAWTFAGLSIGLWSFVVVFTAQLIMFFTDMSLAKSIGVTIGSAMAVGIVAGLLYLSISVLRRDPMGTHEHTLK